MPVNVTEHMLADLVRRIAGAVPARRIILFGSAARGTLGRDSDLDILVVLPRDASRRDAARRAFRSLLGFPVATDIVVAREDELSTLAKNPSLVFFTALQEGRDLYPAAACVV